jgi:hypothetical protein
MTLAIGYVDFVGQQVLWALFFFTIQNCLQKLAPTLKRCSWDDPK